MSPSPSAEKHIGKYLDQQPASTTESVHTYSGGDSYPRHTYTPDSRPYSVDGAKYSAGTPVAGKLTSSIHCSPDGVKYSVAGKLTSSLHVEGNKGGNNSSDVMLMRPKTVEYERWQVCLCMHTYTYGYTYVGE